jgi:hypothetical protein
VTGKRWPVLGSFGLALLVNPYLGCSTQGGSDFTYSEADMKSVALGTWQGSALLDGEAVPFFLTLEQAREGAKAPGSQSQCASRSFVKPAAACTAMTRMPVIGTLTSENPAFNGAVDGDLVAHRTLDEVDLSLHVEGGAVLSGRLEDEAVKDGRIGARLSGGFSLQRP